MDHDTTPGQLAPIRWEAIAAMVTGSVWALVLGVLGLWCVFSEPLRAQAPGATRYAAGLALLLGAQYVFLTVVADRVFPSAPRRVTRASESALLALTGVCSCVLLVSLVMGGAS